MLADAVVRVRKLPGFPPRIVANTMLAHLADGASSTTTTSQAVITFVLSIYLYSHVVAGGRKMEKEKKKGGLQQPGDKNVSPSFVQSPASDGERRKHYNTVSGFPPSPDSVSSHTSPPGTAHAHNNSGIDNNNTDDYFHQRIRGRTR